MIALIAGAIKELFGIGKNLTNGENVEKLKEVRDERKAETAIEYAERTFFLLDEFFSKQEGIEKSELYRKYRFNRARFFENN